jgi:hypothetical protein
MNPFCRLMGLPDPDYCAVCDAECHQDFLLVGTGDTIRGRLCGDCLRDYERQHGEPIEHTANRCQCSVLELVARRAVH